MLKSELVEKVAAATKQPKNVVDEVIGATLDAIMGSPKKPRKVHLTGFGAIEVRAAAARRRKKAQTLLLQLDRAERHPLPEVDEELLSPVREDFQPSR